MRSLNMILGHLFNDTVYMNFEYAFQLKSTKTYCVMN